MPKLLFEDIPETIQKLSNKIDTIVALLESPKKSTSKTDYFDDLIDINEVCRITQLQKATIYSKVSKGEIPEVIKHSGRLYFHKEKIREWILSGKKMSNYDLHKEAENTFISKNTGKI